MQEYKAGPDDVGKRVDVYVAEKYPQFARSSLSMLFSNKLILHSGEVAKAGNRVRINDKISVDDSILFTKPEKIDLPVIYEDDDVVVIDKPAGVLSHSKGTLNLEGTVASFLGTKITDKELNGNRAGIVHRLDRATSGVMIGAKTQPSLKWLQKQFSTRKTKKRYLAIVEGWPEPESAIIDAPIERNSKRPQTFRVGAGGKIAKTEYKTIKKLIKNDKHYTYIELKPETGRTHQLRVHLAHINHPIVGDIIYGSPNDCLFLHASSLELTLPSKERKVFEVALPKIFNKFIDE
jgi:23S rRNA pseudouridine1911/1915/1917 synthase